MIDLRTGITTYLKTLHPRVYFQNAPDDAAYPYITFDFASLFNDGEGGQTIVLDIDGWDYNNSGDTMVLETLMEKINGNLNEEGYPTGLDKQILNTDNLTVTFFLDSISCIVNNDDKRIKTQKYTYEGELIGR